MFNATYFFYDGRSSEEYGLQIADFDSNTVKETDAYSLTLSLQKTPGAVRFFHSGIEFDTAPTCEFSVLSEREIDIMSKRSILSWLTGRKEFKPLRFDGGDNGEFTYYCVFTSVKTIWVSGRCHGFRLTAVFDSPYARLAPTTVKIEGAGVHTVTINNMSDIIDGYTYPIVQFAGTSIDIVNTSDDPERHFTFSGLLDNEVITVDNETKYISSTAAGEKLSNFTSKKWLRLRQGMNTLAIISAGEVIITCPHYAMIGY